MRSRNRFLREAATVNHRRYSSGRELCPPIKIWTQGKDRWPPRRMARRRMNARVKALANSQGDRHPPMNLTGGRYPNQTRVVIMRAFISK
jgi:hypothetical protein